MAGMQLPEYLKGKEIPIDLVEDKNNEPKEEKK